MEMETVKNTTPNNEQRHENKPSIVERSYSLSKDGLWLIHKTIITDITHVNYVNKVLNDGRQQS